MSDAEVKFKFTPEPQKLMTALDDAEKKAKKAEGGIQSFLSSSTKESSGWSTALGGVTKAFGAITALVSAGKVLSFFGDAISEAEELEKKLEEVEAGSASLGESMESIDDRLTESLDGISSNISNRVGGFLLNIKKMVYATFANVAEAINSAFTIKDADKIEEHYEKQSKSLEFIGDELTRLSAIQKRTAEEELQFLKIKEDMTIQLDKLGMSYTTLAQRTTSYKDAMAEAAREAKRQAQEQLWAQAQMLRQSAGMTADKFERGIALNRLRASGDMRSPRARMMLREAAEDRVNDEKRIKLAKELEAKAINLGKPKPVSATGGGGPVTETQVNEQRFIQTRGRLIQIENDRIDTRRKIKAGQDFEDLSEEKKRQLLNADKEARILAENEMGNLTSNYAQFTENKWMMETNFINQQTNAAIRASEELFEAKMKFAEQEHNTRVANGKDEAESEAQMEAEIEAAKESNVKRLKTIQTQSAMDTAKLYARTLTDTLSSANAMAKGVLSIRSGDIAGGIQQGTAGISSMGKNLEAVGALDPNGPLGKAIGQAGPWGAAISAGISLTKSFVQLFGTSDEDRRKEAQLQKERDEQARRIFEQQASYQKAMLEIQQQTAKLPFENLQRQMRLVDIQQQRDVVLGGVDPDMAEKTALEKKQTLITQTMSSEQNRIAEGALFTTQGNTPEELMQFLSERAAQRPYLDPFMQWTAAALGPVGSIQELENYRNQMASVAANIPPEIASVAIAAVDAKLGNFWRLFNAMQADTGGTTYENRRKFMQEQLLSANYATGLSKDTDNETFFGLGQISDPGLGRVSALSNEFGRDVTYAESIVGVFEQSLQIQKAIQDNTKKISSNTSLQLEKDRAASFIDIAGGGIRGFGQLLAGNFGLNTNALTLPTGISNAMLASQGMQTLEEKSYSALKDLVGVSENMRTLLGEIALNTNKMAGANVVGSKSEQEILTMLDNWESRS